MSVLSLILISPQFAFADADTTDGDNEVFYEWVEAYVNFHDSEWDWDTYSDGSHKEQIDFIIFNAPAATSDVVENLAEGIISGNGSWRINNYYTGNDAEEDWVYWDRAPYNIETADKLSGAAMDLKVKLVNLTILVMIHFLLSMMRTLVTMILIGYFCLPVIG